MKTRGGGEEHTPAKVMRGMASNARTHNNYLIVVLEGNQVVAIPFNAMGVHCPV